MGARVLARAPAEMEGDAAPDSQGQGRGCVDTDGWRERNARSTWELPERFNISTVPPRVNPTRFWAHGRRLREIGEAPGKFKEVHGVQQRPPEEMG